MTNPIERRKFLGAALAAGTSAYLSGRHAEATGSNSHEESPRGSKPFLTKPDDFFDVSRGNPRPWKLEGEARVKARLTPESWRLEIVGDEPCEVVHPNRLEDGTALDFAGLEALGKTRGIKFLKAMQCNNIPVPLGQGLWEGVPLRAVLERVGNVRNVRRVYFWGFHNDDPKQLFQSSLGYNQVMETPPWDIPPMIAYRLNGAAIPPKRGGPVRMIVPWAHGFKSIKWLQRIVLTNDYKANDTYALENNDPDSYLKTAAYLDTIPAVFETGKAIVLSGRAMAGWSGLQRVEYWIRPDAGNEGKLADDDPQWKTANWLPCDLMQPPDDWTPHLPEGVLSKDIWGFDPATGRPKVWPPRYSVVPWTVAIKDLKPGVYEFRARAVDLNGIAQPEPRTYQKSGLNRIQCRLFRVMG